MVTNVYAKFNYDRLRIYTDKVFRIENLIPTSPRRTTFVTLIGGPVSRPKFYNMLLKYTDVNYLE